MDRVGWVIDPIGEQQGFEGIEVVPYANSAYLAGHLEASRYGFM